MKGFGDVKGRGDRKKLPRIEEVVQSFDWAKTKGKYVRLRLLPPEDYPFTAIAQQWVTKTVDGEKGVKEVKFPRLIYGYQPMEDAFAEGTEGKDPYIKAGVGEMARSFYVNCIVVSLEKERHGKPTKKEAATGFKNIDPESGTPVRAVRFPFSVIRELAKLEQLNEHRVKNKTGKTTTKTFPVSDARYGRDVLIANDPSQPPAKQYSVQLGDVNPLTEKQRAYLTWDLAGLAKMFTSTETLEEIQAEFDNDFPSDEPKAKGKGAGKGKTYFDEDDGDGDGKKGKSKISSKDNYDLDDDDEPKKSKKKLKKGSKLKSSKSRDDDDEPKKLKKGKSSKSRYDDAPKKKLKKGSKLKSSKKSKRLRDDDIPF